MPRIDNLEFFPGLLCMITWATVVGVTNAVVGRDIISQSILLGAFALTSIWAYRSRHNFGRSSSRGHFDEIDILQLPKRTGDVDLWDPPTKIEKTPEEAKEDRELAKEFQKDLDKGFEKPATSQPPKAKSGGGVVFVGERKQDDSKEKKKSCDFKERQEQHYANEFALAQKMAMEERKRAEERKKEASPTIPSPAKVTSGKSKSDDEKAKEKDFKKRQQDHYANEMVRARQAIEEDRKREQQKKLEQERRRLEEEKKDHDHDKTWDDKTEANLNCEDKTQKNL